MAIDNQPTDPNVPWGWVPTDWLDASAQPAMPTVDETGTPILQPNALQPEAMPPIDADIEMPNIDVADPNAWGASSPPPPIGAAFAPPPIDDALVGSPTFQTRPPPIPAPPLPSEAPVIPALDGEIQLDNVDATPEARDEQLRADLAKRSDEEAVAALYKQRDDDARFAKQRAYEESLKNTHQLELNQAARAEADKATQAKMDALFSEADRLSKTKIDPKRWWHNESTGSKILDVIGAFLGGLAAPYMGGRNPALESIQKSIDADINAQLADIQNGKFGLEQKRGAVADQYRQHGDALLAAEQVRQAMYAGVNQQIEAEMAARDPHGHQFNELDVQRRQVRARALAEAQKYETDEQRRALEIIKVRQEQEKIDESKRAAIAREQTARSAIYSENDRAAKALADKQEDRRLQREIAADTKAQVRQDKADQNELERGIGGAPMTDENGAPIIGKDGKTVKMGPLLQSDGKAFVPKGTTGATDKLREEVNAANQLVAVLDEVERLGPEYLSNTRNSDKLQQLKTLWASAFLTAKDYKHLGVPSGDDKTYIDNFLGTGDPTAFKDSAPGRAKARDLIVAGASSSLQAAGLDHPYTIEKFTGAAKFDENDPTLLRQKAALLIESARDEDIAPGTRSYFRDSARKLIEKAEKAEETNPAFGKPAGYIPPTPPLTPGRTRDEALREEPE